MEVVYVTKKDTALADLVLFPPHGDVISIAHIKTSNIALRCPTRPPRISTPARKGLSSTISVPSAQPSVGIHSYRIRLSRDPHGKVSISDGYITSADDVFFIAQLALGVAQRCRYDRLVLIYPSLICLRFCITCTHTDRYHRGRRCYRERSSPLLCVYAEFSLVLCKQESKRSAERIPCSRSTL